MIFETNAYFCRNEGRNTSCLCNKNLNAHSMKKLTYFFLATLMVLAGCSGGNDDSEILDELDIDEE